MPNYYYRAEFEDGEKIYLHQANGFPESSLATWEAVYDIEEWLNTSVFHKDLFYSINSDLMHYKDADVPSLEGEIPFSEVAEYFEVYKPDVKILRAGYFDAPGIRPQTPSENFKVVKCLRTFVATVQVITGEDCQVTIVPREQVADYIKNVKNDLKKAKQILAEME